MKTKTSVWLAVLVSGLLSLPQAGLAAVKSVSLFDAEKPSLSGWQDSWGDLPSGATVKLDGSKMLVTGNLASQSYGCIYRPITIDLDQTPYLEMDVDSVSSHWYLLVKGDQLPNGWAKIQPDTDQTGLLQFDLRLALGLSGKQSFSEMQLGVSIEGGAGGCKGQTLSLKRLRLVSAAESGPESLQLFGPKNPRLTGWKLVNDDRTPSGVDVLPSTDSVTLRANRLMQSYGMMYKPLRLDVSQYPILKFTVESVTHHWYLILTHPELPKGFVRIQPDSNLTGTFYYDLKEISGLAGAKEVRLQIGVSTNEENPNALGETMTFKELAFLSPKQLPSGAKVLQKKDLKFQQKIQAAVPKVYKQLLEPEPLTVRLTGQEKSAAALFPEKAAVPPDVPKLIGDEYLAEVSPRASSAVSPSFTETPEELAVKNGCYRISFDKKNGAVRSIAVAGQPALITGTLESNLWRIDTQERTALESSRHQAGSEALAFGWNWDDAAKKLQFNYADKKEGADVEIVFAFDASDRIAIEAGIKNRSKKTFLSFSLPNGLLFSVSDLDRVVLPRLIGVAFKPGFFRARKQWVDSYPPAFADFAFAQGRAGALSIYLVQPQDSFQPANLELGASASGEQGYYTHRMPLFLRPQESWRSPALRLSIGRPARETIRDYARENGIDRFPSLSEKLGAEGARRLNRGVFLKVDQSVNVDIRSVIGFLDALPPEAILHLTTFWAGGFDRNYPDYLPPDPEYGTLEDFKQLVVRARARGMRVMPYTNPTWWNDGPTMKKLGEETIAVRNLDGTILRESYNGNPGVVVQPQHPKVVERNRQTVKEFSQTVPMDFLFHDQLGARRWLYQSGVPRPLAYTQDLLKTAEQFSREMPMMTEGGFDRLLPYAVGFCGMTSLSYPRFKEYNDLWGRDNWEIDPISLYIAHDKANFYQHNLSDDVLSDSDEKLAWNVAHGFGLNVARTYIRQNPEKKWIELGDELHRRVLSRILGEKLKGYRRLGAHAVWSRFGAIDVFGNESGKASLAVGDHAVAPYGFLARSADGGLLAGHFVKLNGAALEEDHYFIIESSTEGIRVIQPDAKTTFLTLARPSGWTNDARIRCWQIGKNGRIAVPLAVEPHALTFLYRAESRPERYELRYEARAEALAASFGSPAALRVPGALAVELSLRNGSARAASDVKVRCLAWKVGAGEAAPDLPAADKKGRESQGAPAAVGEIAPGGSQSARFTLEVPPSAFMDGKSVWLRAQIEYRLGGDRVSEILDHKVDLSD